MKKLILVLVITLSSVSIAAADTIYLRGGTQLRGNVLGFINGRFAIQMTANGILPISSNRAGNSTGTTRTLSAGEVIFVRAG